MMCGRAGEEEEEGGKVRPKVTFRLHVLASGVST